ncbi:hypothetical protein V6N13_143934 [Hibiscus sabdariffa]|uniref:Uncharacterized protein n=1 Tax=Hibiscus sabdariffa TaxID=183260 RepID=A0ABR2FJ40_9ROSI
MVGMDFSMPYTAYNLQPFLVVRRKEWPHFFRFIAANGDWHVIGDYLSGNRDCEPADATCSLLGGLQVLSGAGYSSKHPVPTFRLLPLQVGLHSPPFL